MKDPTYVHEHKPESCSDCGSQSINLSKPWIFQQYEIPKVAPIITEYRCYGCTCKGCGAKHSPKLPQGIEYSAFGPNLAARIALFTSKFRSSKRQALSLIKLDQGIDISVGSISNIEERMSTALEKPYVAIHQFIMNGTEARHIDETGMREQAQNCFLWIVSTTSAVFFSIQPGRGKKDLAAFMPLGPKAPVITDRYGVYNFEKHQWCWAHLIRDIRRFSERDGLDGEIGKALLFEAKDMLKTHALCRKGKLDKASTNRSIYYRRKRIEEFLPDAFANGSDKFHRFAGKCLDSLRKLWLFAKCQGVEPTNNRAERDLRPMVIWRKTSFVGTRSTRGSCYLERTMSVIATLERVGKDVITFFKTAYQSRFTDGMILPSPLHP